MGGGCYSGPEGTTCWGDWWVGLALLSLVIGIVILLVVAAVRVARDPAGTLRYYRSKRSLVTIPLTFLASSVLFIVGWGLIYQYHLPFWAQLLVSALFLAIFLAGDLAIHRVK